MTLNGIFDNGISYTAYRALIEENLKHNKTTGNTHTAELVDYTKLNIQRMNRIDKTVELSNENKKQLEKIKKPQNWLVIGDAWCGDCAQIIPVINKIAEASNGMINLKIVSRDAYPELIEQYSTNGAIAIPKLLALTADGTSVIFTWGTRPIPAHNIMLHWKANQATISREDFAKELHLWYAQDKGQTTINELLTKVKEQQ